MAEHTPLDREECLRLLRPKESTVFTLEEKLHPWSVPNYLFNPIGGLPLMRIRDKYTHDQPNLQTGNMSSRSPRKRLDTRAARKQMLCIHANYRNWTPTPFLSFTVGPSEISWMGSKRSSRAEQTVTVINPNSRKHKGLPIVKMEREMMYYEVSHPYCRNDQYYESEYLCLWEVSREEIVGHWDWDDLQKDPEWYENTVLEAFRMHEQCRLDRNSSLIPEAVAAQVSKHTETGFAEHETIVDGPQESSASSKTKLGVDELDSIDLIIAQTGEMKLVDDHHLPENS